MTVTYDRVVVLVLVLLGIGAGTVLPIMRARAKKESTSGGLTFHQPRRDLGERATGLVVGLLGAGHLAWGPLYAWLGPDALWVTRVPPWLFALGALLYLVGLAIVVEAQRTMGRSWRIGIDQNTTSLVSDGVYSLVRNPIYVGAMVCGWAITLCTPSWLTVLGALGYTVFIQVQVRYEERHLYALHGEAFDAFAGRVGRFIPLPQKTLRPSERALLARLAEAVIPSGPRVPGAGEATPALVQAALDEAPAESAFLVRGALWGIEAVSAIAHGERFSEMSVRDRERLLSRWLSEAPGLSRHALRGLVALVKTAHFDAPHVARATGTRTYPRSRAEPPRWLARTRDGASMREDETIEVDVVVVGTGAGGAPVAYELARRGHAVLMLEEGRYFGRHEMVGRASEARRAMFREGGQTLAFGNVMMPIWTGVTVGGSTTINSGTCYRTPQRILRRWRDDLGLSDFTDEAMAEWCARVEAILGVEPTPEAILGGGAHAMRPGLEKLGLAGHAILRNAPGCDGQGRCMFGCPTGAKASTNESYVPRAVEGGAGLVTRARVTEVSVEDGRAKGVVARTAGGATLRVRARATVLSCGALMTPIVLARQGLANRSGRLGANLSVHPAAPVLARFPRRVAMQENVPQSWAIEALADEGVMIEESGNPPEVVAVALPFVGARLLETIERYDQLAAFGVMIEDASRGTVRPGRGGRVAIRYSMSDADAHKLQRGVALTIEAFLAAGAEVVYPAVRGFDEIVDAAGLARFRAARLRPEDFALSAVHPLGTAAMGTDPRASVVGPDHQVHDVPDLYVVDGASVPTALGVNPQITIMAMAHRAAELLDARLR
ncbi:MAG: FAD-dependent oxidoreductase [Sandaracinaceae bacterium]|nr:FAD-dependent oxidoreductase [Sandaracinaceae bacterium]